MNTHSGNGSDGGDFKVVHPPELLMKFVKWLSKPEKKRDARDYLFEPSIIMLADLMWSRICGNRTCLKTLLGITVHGSIRSKELVMLLKELGLSISYIDVQDFYAAWTLYETIRNPICPEEIKEGIPGIAIIDNDDFREDTLTGCGTTHTTNMVLLQSESNANESHPPTERHDEVLEVPSLALSRNQHFGLTALYPYKTNKRGNPSPINCIISIQNKQKR